LPGAFGAECGRGIGGLVKAETRTLPRDGPHGYVAIDAIDASALISTALSGAGRPAPGSATRPSPCRRPAPLRDRRLAGAAAAHRGDPAASWTADSAEPFPVFDPASRTLVDHREAIRVSWFVSAGALAEGRTGRAEAENGAETETFADDVWTTPDAGPAYLWVVIRDSRGGLAFAGHAVTIAP
jgi:hypothetical protein